MPNNNRRSFISKAITLSSAAVLPLAGIGNAIEQQSEVIPLPALNGRKILFTYGGWNGHEPEKFRDYLMPWLKGEGAEVFAFNTLDPYRDKALMSTIDLVLQIFTMDKLTGEQEKGLLEAIEKNGTGMAGWHGGMCDAFRNSTDYQFMTGGQFVNHPGGVTDYSVKIMDKRDAVTKGLKNFMMHDEQYYLHVDPNIKVLATTRFSGKFNSWIDGCVVPIAWKKMHGKGRIFYTSLGHNLNNLTAVPEALELLQRGIKWASGSKYFPAEKWLSAVYGR